MNDMTSCRCSCAGSTIPALIVAISLTAACAGVPAGTPGDGALRVTDVAPAEYHGAAGHPLEEACRTWGLSPSQVQAFFRFADAYEDRPYQRFYQVGCSISGHLQAEGRDWRFAINGGGVATWQDGSTTRHFGCSAKECETLVLLPTDGMEPE
ncbi:hypothetical protein QFW77_11185 [Luteimonas sp. RD2P54]|uniref:Uncharacterized protein n=1 Tax=Luteimonas endophytica TaxID=3042023 RepID=A0ABT6J9X2_9GAMM|nr:hypothetical protein [Luteimonas endophytica]MDH5823549.1 hypothetical protein [Luteimonas endophytica]